MFLLILAFLSCGIMIGDAQGQLMGEMTGVFAQRVAFLAAGGTIILAITGLVLIYTVHSRETNY